MFAPGLVTLIEILVSKSGTPPASGKQWCAVTTILDSIMAPEQKIPPLSPKVRPTTGASNAISPFSIAEAGVNERIKKQIDIRRTNSVFTE